MSEEYYDGRVSTELERLRWLQEYGWMEAAQDNDVRDWREKMRFLQDRIVGGIENDMERAKKREESPGWGFA